MNSRYTTLEEIIERVQRDYGLDVNDSEAAEWTWDAITQIGVLTPFEEKIQQVFYATIGKQFSLIFQPVDSIKRTKDGKYQYLIQKLPIKFF